MKHVFTMALSVCMVPVSFGQLTLLSGEMLPFNSSFTMLTVQDPSAVDTSLNGAGVTWNFATLQPAASGAYITTNIVNPAGTPYASSFPSANYAYYEQPNGAYRYFTLTGTKMERVGSYSGGALKTYTDPQIEYVFPLALGVSSNDTWANTASSFGGVYNLTCTGTGTLILPSGSYDALKVRVYVEDGPLALTTYFWYDADNGSILLQYIEGDGIFTSTSARYLSQITLNTKESELLQNLTYNNPVEGTLNLGFQNAYNETFTYRLYDINGRTVADGQIANAGQQAFVSRDMSHLAPGLYYFTLANTSGTRTETLKLIKQ